VHDSGELYYVNIVWQQYTGSNYAVKWSRSSDGLEWDAMTIPGTPVSNSSLAKPVIVSDYYTGSITDNICWNGGDGIYCSSFINAAGGTPVKVNTTNSYCKNPTIIFINSYNVGLAWENSSTSDVHYTEFDYLTGPASAAVTNVTSAYSNLSGNKNPSIALDAANENVMLTWQATTSTIPPKGGTITFAELIYARKKSVGGNWGTLKTLQYSTYEGQTPTVGSINNDFSVMWKVKSQDKLLKLDYVSGLWDLTVETEIFTGTGIKDPSLSTGSDKLYLMWSKYSSVPYRIHHETFSNPTKAKQPKSVSNSVYRDALIDLGNLNPDLTGHVVLRLGTVEDGAGNTLASFSPDQETESSFMSTPFFNMTGQSSRLEIRLQLFGAGLLNDYSDFGNPEFYRVILSSDDNSAPAVLRTFTLHDIQADSNGFYYLEDDILVELTTTANRKLRIDVDFLYDVPGNVKPAFSEVFALNEDDSGLKTIQDGFDMRKTPLENQVGIKEFALHSAYPNPFNPQTTVTFDLPEKVNVTIRIYDSTGKTVATLINGLHEAGRHRVRFMGTNLASGLYFCEMRAGNFKQVQKMLLVK
jgi:hypothetical protein